MATYSFKGPAHSEKESAATTVPAGRAFALQSKVGELSENDGRGEGHHFSQVAIDAVNAPASGGKSLPHPILTKMEGAFGHDFAGVRVHESPAAPGIGAVAYTRGENIHFAPGQYQPESSGGQQLLAHELTHVVQQREGRVSASAGGGPLPINDDASLESEADALGARAARGESAGSMSAQPAPAHNGLQMKEEDEGKSATPAAPAPANEEEME
jgi:Domain of unknown function (DUF4157)